MRTASSIVKHDGGSGLTDVDDKRMEGSGSPRVGSDMVQLVDADIRTRDVLEWKGLHVLQYSLSSRSQKLRIFLNLKGLDWRSHPIDIVANAHLTPYYLGINPRGLVPVIVEDGVVHIESNDIILHLEREHPEPRLVPADRSEEVAAMLRHESDLHLDLRTLTFRFLFDPAHPTKSRQDLDRYAADAGTVQGARDRDVEREVSFWSDYLENGVGDEQARASAARQHGCATHSTWWTLPSPRRATCWATTARSSTWRGWGRPIRPAAGVARLTVRTKKSLTIRGRAVTRNRPLHSP
jgi:glutathione S-transferase